MSAIKVNVVGEYLTGYVNGKSFGVSFSDQRYSQMKDLEKKADEAKTTEELKAIIDEFLPMTVESYKEIVEHAKGGQYLFVNKATGKIYLAINGKQSNKPLPKSFVDRIILSVEKKIDVMPLVKCWTRFLRNPWYTDDKAKRFANYINTTVVNHKRVTELQDKEGLSKDVAIAMSTEYDVSITNEGLLATFKVVNEIDWSFVADEDRDYGKTGVKKVQRFDFEVDEITGAKTYKKPEFLEDRYFEPSVVGQGYDSFFCGEKEGHIIRVGQVHYLDSWNKVDRRDSASCVKGLHAGGLQYINTYQKADNLTLDIFIDPMHIGAITDDGTGALRVLKFYAHGAMTGTTKGLYHSSTYAALTDDEYRQMITEVVNATADKKVKEARDEQEEAMVLLP